MTVEELMEWLRRADGRIEDMFGLWTQGKRDDRWVAEKLISEGHLAALADEQRDTLDAALDVELLAEAIANVPHGSSFHEQISGRHLPWPLLDERAQGHTRDFARKVAAQYAARLKGEKP